MQRTKIKVNTENVSTLCIVLDSCFGVAVL